MKAHKCLNGLDCDPQKCSEETAEANRQCKEDLENYKRDLESKRMLKELERRHGKHNLPFVLGLKKPLPAPTMSQVFSQIFFGER